MRRHLLRPVFTVRLNSRGCGIAVFFRLVIHYELSLIWRCLTIDFG